MSAASATPTSPPPTLLMDQGKENVWICEAWRPLCLCSFSLWAERGRKCDRLCSKSQQSLRGFLLEHKLSSFSCTGCSQAKISDKKLQKLVKKEPRNEACCLIRGTSWKIRNKTNIASFWNILSKILLFCWFVLMSKCLNVVFNCCF